MKVMPAVTLVLPLVVGFGVANSMAHGTMSKTGVASEVNRLIGSIVRDSQGENIGTIADIGTGPKGRAAFAVLSYWVSDDTQGLVAVPLSALSCGEENCVLNASKDILESAPAFVSEEDLANPKMAGDIFRYFGVAPYWIEEGSEK